MTFRLIGHDCPTGEYPSPVVPVGMVDGHLVVSFRTSVGVEFETIEDNALFVRHDPDLGNRLKAFDVEREALFAFSASDVVAFEIANEPRFFESLLEGTRLSRTDPFFRLSLASAANNEDLIIRELITSTRAISRSTPYFLGDWYRNVIGNLVANGPPGQHWPADANEILDLDEDRLPRSAHAVLSPLLSARTAARGLIRRLRNTVSDFGGNGNLTHLDKVLANNASHAMRVIFTGSSTSSTLLVVDGLVNDVAVTRVTANRPLISELESEHYLEISYSEEPTVRVRGTDGSVAIIDFDKYLSMGPEISGLVQTQGETRIEMGLPASLCRLGFVIVVAPRLLFRRAWDALSSEILVYVLGEAAALSDQDFPFALRAVPTPQQILVCDYKWQDGQDAWLTDNMRRRLHSFAGPIEVRTGEGSRRNHTNAGRIGRVRSGIAALEEAIANAAVHTSQTPMLRADIDGSIRIGKAHLAHLQTLTETRRRGAEAVEQRLELVSRERRSAAYRLRDLDSEIERRFEKVINDDIEELANVIRKTVMAEVEDWKMPTVGILFWSKGARSILVQDLEALMERCSRRVNSHGEEFTKILANRLSRLSDSITQRMRDLRESSLVDPMSFRRYPEFVVDAPGLDSTKSVVGSVAGAAIGLILGPVALIGGAVLPLYSKEAEARIKDRLLNGHGEFPGLLALLDEWTASVRSRVVRVSRSFFVSYERTVREEMHHMEAELSEFAAGLHDAREQADLLESKSLASQRETEDIVRRLEGILGSLPA